VVCVDHVWLIFESERLNCVFVGYLVKSRKKISQAWSEQERCPFCYHQGAPDVWKDA
jgi:hypothetical protein